ncbi:sce7726 family protein [Aneurinibacillus thermoaerophilus]|uniref:sce7726 family protein n=1 Tax=Aneurinibacillus thermoaerophilus TaxID=143495 RepID=UPI002E1CC625|nr:sce7726 family protein [Aneurinibacillus thermoaerophilus]MED0759008.1 sce7726 family protein [Aneurinibacillus thermoaerophilus]MED0762330.1 sce7726 family protein [Aneurinibacillus thermoaerophilus]
MKRFLNTMNNFFTNEEIFSIAQKLNQSYYAYMLDEQVWALLFVVFPESFHPTLQNLKHKKLGHDIVNLILMNYYPGERLLKYHLVKDFIKHKDEVALFEMKIEKSRLDVGRINGYSYAYEIKTELDSLTKLQKQIAHYALVFEFITVILHPKHLSKASEMLPDFCGIITYHIDSLGCQFQSVREALKSPCINSKTQIDTLNSKDLEYILKFIGEKNIPAKRSEREAALFSNVDFVDINFLFKEAIKNRYKERWSYLCKFFKKINPIDIQELYIGPINPDVIYYKTSSIV